MKPQLFDLMNQVMLSRALYVAANLSIADHLEHEPLMIQDLAEKTGSDAPSLYRLLRFLIAHGIFATKNRTYTNNELSTCMTKNHRESLRPFLLHDDETRWNALGHLEYSVKSGKPSFDMLYKKNYFEYLRDHPLLSKQFDEAMNIVSASEEELIVKKLAVKGIVADIGGGQGNLLKRILSVQASVTKGILFDLQQVIVNVKNLPTNIQAVSGSFFESIQVDADVYILKRILHDWDDEKCTLILKNIATAMKPQSKLYIIDAIVDKCTNVQRITDIDLRLFTIFGGKERELPEFESIFANAGLKINSYEPITDIIHVIECGLAK